jgi:two-component system NtrC family response regulator
VKLQYIVEAVQGALQCRGEKSVALPREILRTEGIVGNSREIRVCMELMSKATLTDTSVLILGETGTGKELFARAIHSNSRRRQKNFVVVDCAALPENLVESVLFGYARGAFTGADMPRDGLVKQADGGTLFLDEIGEMPPALQKPFLRVLQEKVFRPVGGDKEIHSDFRLVTATNRDLDVLVAEGRFREDLLFRLRSVTLNLPPLRDRIADIQELIIYHLRRICEQYGWPLKAIAPEFVEFLSQYTWPGNVRELVHALESALIAAEGQGTLFPQHLPDGIRIQVIRRNTSAHIPEQPASLSEHSGANVPTAGIGSLKEIREAAADAAEKQYLLELIAATRNNVNEACQLSDLSRSRFYTLLRKHHISTRE